MKYYCTEIFLDRSRHILVGLCDLLSSVVAVPITTETEVGFYLNSDIVNHARRFQCPYLP
jgi:hypothetical protein